MIMILTEHQRSNYHQAQHLSQQPKPLNMFGNYNLYFHNLPTLESRCKTAGIPVEPFLCSAVSHVVVLNKASLCPKLLNKITSLGVKLVSSRAVNKWLVDYNIVKKQNSSPPKPKPAPAVTPIITQRAALVVQDVEKAYKPQFLTKSEVPFYPDHACSGSPWAKNMSPGDSKRAPTNTMQSRPSGYRPATQNTIPTTQSRTQSRPNALLLPTQRKIFCENCRVSVSDLDAHFKTIQHRRYAENNKNFAELDAVIGDLTLDNLFSASNKKRRVQVPSLRLTLQPQSTSQTMSRPCPPLTMGFHFSR